MDIPVRIVLDVSDKDYYLSIFEIKPAPLLYVDLHALS